MTDKPPLRIVFMGSPDFAVHAMGALRKAKHDIVAVYCQPPKPAGRGQQLQPTPVQVAAEAMGIEVHTPRSLRDKAEQETFADLKADVAVVAAYGLILPKEILAAPKHGCINIHASLLPRWRGAAPIQRAILAGDETTGITTMQMDEGLDTGAMLMQKHMGLTVHTTAQSLHDDLAAMGGELIVETLDALRNNRLTVRSQPDSGIVYAEKLTRKDGQIDWSRSAAEIERQMRALTPWPGCFFALGGETVKLLAARIVSDQHGPEGTLLDDEFTVACGDKTGLRLLKVQRPGKTVTDGAALLRGLRLPIGSKL